MNPLDWPAGPFLTLYVAVATAALLILLGWRNRLGPGGHEAAATGLNALHVAYLAGGAERALDTALVGLFEAEAATFNRRRGVMLVDRDAPVPPELLPFRHVGNGESGRRDFHRAFAIQCERIRTELARHGLVPSVEQVGRFRVGAFAVLCIPLLLGLCKVAVGLDRGRPVGILMALLGLTAVLGGMLILARPSRNRAGTAILAQLRRDNARAARAPVPAEVTLAFALSGSAVLAGRYYQVFLHGGGAGSGDGGSDSSGGGGDGGGGCGGCSG